MAELEKVGPDRIEELRRLLTRDSVQNLFLLGILEEHGLSGRSGSAPMRFLGLGSGGEMTAVAFVGGSLVVPCVYDTSVASELSKALTKEVRLRGCLGERFAVDALYWALGRGAVRVSRPQRLLAATADGLGPFVEPQLKQAELSDADEIMSLSASWVRELMGRDPMTEDPSGFRSRIERRLAAGRTFVVRQGREIAFKIDIGARSVHGAELEGAYTAPQFRRGGLATRALGQLCRTLLSAMPVLTMRADERDAALLGVCQKVGFHATRPQRLLVLD